MAALVLTWSRSVPRRHAEMTPVSTPSSMATTVPSVTMGMVLARAVFRLPHTGSWLAKDTPRFPCTSCFR